MLAKLSAFGMGALTHMQSLKENLTGSAQLPVETDASSNAGMAIGEWVQIGTSAGPISKNVYLGLDCASYPCKSDSIVSSLQNGIMFNGYQVNSSFTQPITIEAEQDLAFYPYVVSMTL